MAKTHKKVFDGIFAQLEETDGDVVLFDAKGSYAPTRSVICSFRMSSQT